MQKFNPRKIKYIKIVDSGFKILFHTKKEHKQINWNKVKSILIVDFTGIGDLVMLTPLLRVLRDNAPSAIIFLCCNPYGKDLLGEQGLVDKFFLLDGKKYINSIWPGREKKKVLQKFVNLVNKNEYDVILEPRGDLRYIHFMHYLNGERKVSYNYTGGEEFLTDVVEPKPEVKHLLEDKMVFAKKIGLRFNWNDITPRLSISYKGKMYVKKYLQDHVIDGELIIGIHPGASAENKRWNKFPSLLLALYHMYQDVRFLVFTSEGEERFSGDIVDAAKSVNARFELVSEKMLNYVRLLSLCNVLICNDSGAAHIGAAYGNYVVDIFGPFYPELAVPLGENVIPISHTLDCKTCNNTICKKGRAECIEDITLEEVLMVARKQIENVRNNSGGK